MKVEIWSDVVCPWCAIGKARFEHALARFEHRDDVAVTYRSFELDPAAPPELPGPLVEHLAAKYGVSTAQAQQMQDRVTVAAAAEGLDFQFDIARSGNTFDAHRLLHLAAEHGLQHQMKDRLLRAYFTQGEPIGDAETLTRLAADVGIPAQDAADVLGGDRFAEAVRADEAQARAYGISGVPFFVVDGTYGVSGAQPPQLLLEVLQKAWADAHPLTLVAADGGADQTCTEGDCVV